MGIKETLKERIINGFKGFGRLRFQTSHASIMSFSALLLILFVAFTIRVLPLRWEIPSGTVRLNEFDPYYQFILTRYMVQNGLLSPYWPIPWVNTQQWYPQGLNMASSLPALPMTAAALYNVISFLGVNVDLMTFASIFPTIMGTLSCLIMYFVGKDIGGKPTGLLAALFLALAPSFLQRTALGFFDTEVPGVLGLLLFIYVFFRAIEETRPLSSSLKYSFASALVLAYFIAAWGAAYFLIDLAVVFVLVLILLKRYSQRLLLSYGITFGVALFVATKVQYISLGYLTSGPVIPVAGIFLLLCLLEVLRHNISARTKVLLAVTVLVVLVVVFSVLWQLGYVGDIAGKFKSVLDPFARAAIPILESVAEHRISAWGNIYYELGIGILFFLAGLYFTLRNPTNRNVFLLLFGLTSLYAAASMVRLLVIFAPAFSLLVAIGILGVLKPFYTLFRETPHIATKTKRGLARVSKEYSGIAVFLVFILVVTNVAFSPQKGGDCMPRVYDQAYAPITITSSSLPYRFNEPVQEWLNMLSWTQNNLESTTVVCAWWDYGYWLSILGNVTTLADNATINTTQIENIGFIFMANETQSLPMLEQYNAKYILVFTALRIPTTQSSGTSYYTAYFAGVGDESKWMWMAKISGQAQERFIRDGFIDENSSWRDETTFANMTTGAWYDSAKNATIYKLMSWGKQRWCDVSGGGLVIPDEAGVQPEYFKEAYFAGEDLSWSDAFSKYYGIVPLVCLYEIDWQAYYNATSSAT